MARHHLGLIIGVLVLGGSAALGGGAIAQRPVPTPPPDCVPPCPYGYSCAWDAAGELVAGPKAGIGVDWVRYQDTAVPGWVNYSAQAWTVGATGGVLFRVGARYLAGALVSFDYWKNSGYLVCETLNGDCQHFAPASKPVSLVATFLF
jgi:hypothetical protein